MLHFAVESAILEKFNTENLTSALEEATQEKLKEPEILVEIKEQRKFSISTSIPSSDSHNSHFTSKANAEEKREEEEKGKREDTFYIKRFDETRRPPTITCPPAIEKASNCLYRYRYSTCSLFNSLIFGTLMYAFSCATIEQGENDYCPKSLYFLLLIFGSFNALAFCADRNRQREEYNEPLFREEPREEPKEPRFQQVINPNQTNQQPENKRTI